MLLGAGGNGQSVIADGRYYSENGLTPLWRACNSIELISQKGRKPFLFVRPSHPPSVAHSFCRDCDLRSSVSVTEFRCCDCDRDFGPMLYNSISPTKSMLLPCAVIVCAKSPPGP